MGEPVKFKKVLAASLAALVVLGSVGWLVLGPQLHELKFKIIARDDFTLTNCQPQESDYEFGVFARGESSQFVVLNGSWQESAGNCLFVASAWLPQGTESIKPRFTQRGISVSGTLNQLGSTKEFKFDVSQTMYVTGTLRLFSAIPDKYKPECRVSLTTYFGGPCSNIYLGVMDYPQSCSGHRGLDYATEGSRVRIEDESGTELGKGSLSEGAIEMDLDVAKASQKFICKFTFSIPDLPKVKSTYRVSLSGAKDFVVSLSELESKNFKLDLAIGQ